jgi:hypothetical protein
VSEETIDFSKIFNNYSDIEQVILLEKDDVIENDTLIIYGKIDENEKSVIENTIELVNYSIIFSNSVDRKLKKYIKQNGYYVYKRQEKDFVNYCTRLYMKKDGI